jgi:hypothetical protein
MTFDPNAQRIVAGQAVTKSVEAPYSPDMKLGQQ